MSAIFISYRRGQVTVNVAHRLRDALVERYGDGSAFFDITGVPGGAHFAQVLHEKLQSCCAMVVLIDPRWVSDEGRRRLHEPNDWVRLEVEAALRRGIAIFPVLLDDTAMPEAAQLPYSMAELSYRQGVEISSKYLADDVVRLFRGVDQVLAEAQQPSEAHARAGAQEVDWSPATLAEAGWVPAYERMSRPIAAPHDLVWNRMVDVARYPEDMAGVDEVELLTADAVRPGFRALLIRNVPGSVTFWMPDLAPMLRSTVELAFLDVVAPLRFAVTSTSWDQFTPPTGPQTLGLYWLSWDGSTTVVHIQQYRDPAAAIDLKADVDAKDAWLHRVARATERRARR